jgi:hypothetical protein
MNRAIKCYATFWIVSIVLRVLGEGKIESLLWGVAAMIFASIASEEKEKGK